MHMRREILPIPRNACKTFPLKYLELTTQVCCSVYVYISTNNCSQLCAARHQQFISVQVLNVSIITFVRAKHILRLGKGSSTSMCACTSTSTANRVCLHVKQCYRSRYAFQICCPLSIVGRLHRTAKSVRKSYAHAHYHQTQIHILLFRTGGGTGAFNTNNTTRTHSPS